MTLVHFKTLANYLLPNPLKKFHGFKVGWVVTTTKELSDHVNVHNIGLPGAYAL